MGALLDEKPHLFFHELLCRALADPPLAISDMTHFYLVNVLAGMVRPEHDPVAPISDRWLRANSGEVTRSERVMLLRGIGDDTLMLCGFWWQRVYRLYGNRLDVRFHIDMARQAYHLLGSEKDMEHFNELTTKFRHLLDALVRMGQECSQSTEADVVRLLDMWHQANSAYALRALAKLGLTPGDMSPKRPS